MTKENVTGFNEVEKETKLQWTEKETKLLLRHQTTYEIYIQKIASR